MVSLRNFVKLHPESLSDMLIAAEDRYREGEELLLRGEYDGCIYLFGYAAEMWLKATCLRLQGLGPLSPVKAALAPLRTFMKINAPSVPFTDFHDLSYLAQAIMHLRLSKGRPLPRPILTELGLRIASRLHDDWIVDMRYRRSAHVATDAWKVLLNVWWLKSNWAQLT